MRYFSRKNPLFAVLYGMAAAGGGLLTAAAASAQQDGVKQKNRYIGLNAVDSEYVYYTDQDLAGARQTILAIGWPQATSQKRKSRSLSFYYGHKLKANLGIEFGYIDLGEYQVQVEGTNATGSAVITETYRSDIILLLGQFVFSQQPRYRIYGKAGPVRLSFEAVSAIHNSVNGFRDTSIFKQSSTGLIGGIGVDFAFKGGAWRFEYLPVRFEDTTGKEILNVGLQIGTLISF